MDQCDANVPISDKLETTDVWKEFNCPIYIAPNCAKTDKIPKELFDFDGHPKFDVDYILQKLHELISDPVASTSVLRICRFLHDYLCYIGTSGYVSFDKYIFSL